MEAKIINCKECGRLFSSVGGIKVCTRCRDTHEKEFQTVREYLYDNPDASLKDVEDDTGVSHESLMTFLRDGRLEFKGENLLLNCERCDKPIATGRYCEDCQAEMAKSLGAAGKEIASSIDASSKKEIKKAFHSKK